MSYYANLTIDDFGWCQLRDDLPWPVRGGALWSSQIPRLRGRMDVRLLHDICQRGPLLTGSYNA